MLLRCDMLSRMHAAARLKHWAGNAIIGLGAVAAVLTMVAGLAALLLVFGAAGRLLMRWCEYYPE